MPGFEVATFLPDAWISKIFSKFEARYGSLFIDRWRDCDMANVRETWAEELAEKELHASNLIQRAVESQQQEETPTNTARKT